MCLCLQVIRDVLLLGHRQAFAWIDEWIGEMFARALSRAGLFHH